LGEKNSLPFYALVFQHLGAYNTVVFMCDTLI
jgi:hypothetical protein